MNEEIMEKLSKKLEMDIQVEESSEPEYLLRLSSKIVKWQTLYSKKITEFKRLELSRDVKYKELYMYYQFEFDVKLDKKELNTFINADSEYQTILKHLYSIENQMQFIERAIKTLESQSWNLRSRLEYLKALGYVNG